MQQNDSLRLVVRRGAQPNQHFAISKNVTTLGRDISNDIVINDRETSRHHLRLMRTGDTLAIEDLGSTNGTFVNGKRVSGLTPLQNGDMIGLGETVTLALEVFQESSQPAPDDLSDTPVPPPRPTPLGEPIAAQPEFAPPPTEYGLQGVSPPAAPSPAPSEDDASRQVAYPVYADQPTAPAQQPGYYPQQPGYQTPPAPPQAYPGYDYDPYAVREESGGTSPWLILGCFVFFVLVMVCFAGIALTIIDVLNLWCEVPVVSDVVVLLGYSC